MKRLPGLQKCLLNQVFGFRSVANYSHGRAIKIIKMGQCCRFEVLDLCIQTSRSFLSLPSYEARLTLDEPSYLLNTHQRRGHSQQSKNNFGKIRRARPRLNRLSIPPVAYPTLRKTGFCSICTSGPKERTSMGQADTQMPQPMQELVLLSNTSCFNA